MRSPIWCAVIDGQLHARSHVGRGQRHQVDDALKHDAAQFHVWHLAVIEQPTHVAIPLSTDANIGVTHRKAKGVVIALWARIDLHQAAILAQEAAAGYGRRGKQAETAVDAIDHANVPDVELWREGANTQLFTTAQLGR